MKQDKTFKEFIEHIGPKNTFTRDELYEYYKMYTPSLNDNTFRSRIHRLKQRKIIRQIGGSVYSILVKPIYEPKIDSKLLRLYRLIGREYKWVKYCVWNSNWLNEFMVHQPVINYSLVEVGEGIDESVFNYLKSNRLRNVYHMPNTNLIDKYILEDKDAIIVIPLITRSPVRQYKNIKIPYLEKILVDIFCNKSMFISYSGKELDNIFRNANERYSLNYSKLLNYSNRRVKGKELLIYLQSQQGFTW